MSTRLARYIDAAPATAVWRERSLWFGAGAVAWTAAVYGVAVADGGGRAWVALAMIGIPAMLAFGCGYYWRGAIPTTLLKIDVLANNPENTSVISLPAVVAPPDAPPTVRDTERA